METFLSLADSVSTFEEILEEKPTLDELCEHIIIGTKWIYKNEKWIHKNDVFYFSNEIIDEEIVSILIKIVHFQYVRGYHLLNKSKLCNAFEADPLRIANGLIADDLISSNLRKS